MAEVSIFLDPLSQPCRAVYMFAKANAIPFTYELVQLLKGEQLKEEFLKINAFHKVPALKDGDFCLSESTAILLYLMRKYNTPDHWYPSDLQKRARVDEYLAWQHTNIRVHCSKVFWAKYMAKNLDAQLSSDKLNQILLQFTTILTDFEKVFLRDATFLVGDEISIADVVAIVELMQVVACGLDLFDDRPKLAAWKRRVVAAIGEELFNEAHEQILATTEHMESIPETLVEWFKVHLAVITK